ncbi:MAG TPA: glycosyltransferase, partial [Alphaproteobacteria bacterium]|nr:glycosyltransferase [Alphaproteobacteria bacterium]
MNEGLPDLDIMGIKVRAATAPEAVAFLDRHLDGSAPPLKLAYLNAHTSNLAASNPAFTETLTRFVVLNDGIGVDIAARLLHAKRFPANLNGTDFTVRYLAETRHTLRLYLIGSQDGVAAQAAEHLAQLAPRHTIVGTQHGYFAPERGDEVLAALRQAQPDLVLVAFGNPAQEFWIDQHAEATGARLLIGVGALFDFLSGRVSRAPQWVRDARFEWAYRLALEPRRRARRYLAGNPYFLARVL